MIAAGRWLTVLWGCALSLSSASLAFGDLSDATFYGGGSVVGYGPYFLIALVGIIGSIATAFRRVWGAVMVALASAGLLIASLVIWQNGSWQYRAPFSPDNAAVGIAILIAGFVVAAVVAVAMARAARGQPAA